MSYDFAVLTPEAAGPSEEEALARARDLYDRGSPATAPDRRLRDFVAKLEGAGAADEERGWVSVWPVDAHDLGLAIPTTYANVDDNLVTLLRLAAEKGLVLVDLTASRVHPPAPGEPVGVIAGDGSRLGALTRARLDSLVADLPPEDPWLVLERDREDYVQTHRQDDSTFLLEHRDGSADRHSSSSVADETEVAARMWAWLSRDPAWTSGLTWDRVAL